MANRIGRYENGELVIHTIGIAAKKEQLHRYVPDPAHRQAAGGGTLQSHPRQQFLEALVKIEDEDTFNEPMYMAKRWRKEPNVWHESICAENGGARSL